MLLVVNSAVSAILDVIIAELVAIVLVQMLQLQWAPKVYIALSYGR